MLLFFSLFDIRAGSPHFFRALCLPKILFYSFPSFRGRGLSGKFFDTGGIFLPDSTSSSAQAKPKPLQCQALRVMQPSLFLFSSAPPSSSPVLLVPRRISSIGRYTGIQPSQSKGREGFEPSVRRRGGGAPQPPEKTVSVVTGNFFRSIGRRAEGGEAKS